jgi:hypothetical protein
MLVLWTAFFRLIDPILNAIKTAMFIGVLPFFSSYDVDVFFSDQAIYGDVLLEKTLLPLVCSD